MKKLAATLAVALVTALAPLTAQAQATDAALVQTVTADEPVAPRGTAVKLTEGHADIGPVIVDGRVELLLRDDSATPPTWRYLEDVTVVLADEAVQTVAKGYDFTGAHAGDTVWVVPQTEVTGVPWLGWNTQHPSLNGQDATLHFGTHEGDGDFSVFLQNGGFSTPQVVAETMFVPAGTHAHANWVFTAPGAHTVPLSVTVGETTTEPVPLRFAVEGEEADTTQQSSLPWWLLGIGALVLVAGIVAVVRGRR